MVIVTSGNVHLHSGRFSDILTDEDYAKLIFEAEGQLIADTKVNWVDIWPTISGNTNAGIVQGAVAAYASISVTNFHKLSLGSLPIATTTINVNLNKYDRAVKQLKESNVYKPLGGTQIQTT